MGDASGRPWRAAAAPSARSRTRSASPTRAPPPATAAGTGGPSAPTGSAVALAAQVGSHVTERCSGSRCPQSVEDGPQDVYIAETRQSSTASIARCSRLPLPVRCPSAYPMSRRRRSRPMVPRRCRTHLTQRTAPFDDPSFVPRDLHLPAQDLDPAGRPGRPAHRSSAASSAASTGLVVALGFALVLNVGMYWFSDRIALKANGARPLQPGRGTAVRAHRARPDRPRRHPDARPVPHRPPRAQRVRDRPQRQATPPWR